MEHFEIEMVIAHSVAVAIPLFVSTCRSLPWHFWIVGLNLNYA